VLRAVYAAGQRQIGENSVRDLEPLFKSDEGKLAEAFTIFFIVKGKIT